MIFYGAETERKARSRERLSCCSMIRTMKTKTAYKTSLETWTLRIPSLYVSLGLASRRWNKLDTENADFPPNLHLFLQHI